MKIANPLAVKGENLACNYLKRKGYRIIERNFRKGYGEIDIVALHPAGLGQAQVLVFVEVKTRTSDLFGPPLEAITPWKIRTLVKTAQYYKLLHPQLPDSLRLDAIGVDFFSNPSPKIEHVKNITE
ncbi:MAG: YraN family protein [Candidatus Levybacteria bacterium]|nr:YraN family protein [Candidatus Levybacteria bacterium]